MSSTIFSRSFLQGIPEQRKQHQIDSIIQGFINKLQNAAAEGKTYYLYDQNNIKPETHQLQTKMYQLHQNPPLPTITTDDLVSAFKIKFPDCDISYQETWVEVNSINKVLKKGIIIDWS
jgi:hypothetical protein